MAGGLIWYAKPKPKPPRPEVIQTETGPMLLVPAGRFLYGPGKRVTIVPDFYIDANEVSNLNYAKFCKATGHSLPSGFPEDQPNLPVVNVTYLDAQAFAKWAGKRLPIAQEWEKAARGTEGALYPWGNDADPSRCNVADNPGGPHALVVVTAFPKSSSPFRAVNMTGNVAEWIDENTTPSPDAIAKFVAMLNPPATLDEKWTVIKGGSFQTPLKDAIPQNWRPAPARYAAADLGFRCIRNSQ